MLCYFSKIYLKLGQFSSVKQQKLHIFAESAPLPIKSIGQYVRLSVFMYLYLFPWCNFLLERD